MNEILFFHCVPLSFQVSALFSIRRVQTVESSGGQRLQERQRATQHPDQDSAAPTNQKPTGQHRKTTGRETHTQTPWTSVFMVAHQEIHLLLGVCLFLFFNLMVAKYLLASGSVCLITKYNQKLKQFCFRCLFLIGLPRCIDSNFLRMSRLCMMCYLPSPGKSLSFQKYMNLCEIQRQSYSQGFN